MQRSDKVRVVIVDDHTMVAESLRRALTLEHDVEVLAIAGDLAEALEVVAALAPDVVVLDLRLPDATGASAVRTLRRVAPEVRVIACAGQGSTEIEAAARAAGAVGYIEKVRPLQELADAIVAARAAASPPTALGRRATPAPGSARRVTASDAHRRLSAREHEVLALVGEGVSTRAIADRLDISPHTVRKHVQTILGKLDAHSKLEGVARARRLGILDDARRD